MSTYGIFKKRKIKESQLDKEAEKLTREIFTGEILEDDTRNEKMEGWLFDGSDDGHR